MDAGSTPPILRHHAPDEIPQLGVGPRPSWPARDPPPVSAIRSSVPGDDGSGLDDCERRGPVGPHPPQRDPEQAVGGYEPWTAATVSEGSKLVSQGEIVEDERLSRECQGATGPEGELEEKKHRPKMRADRCDSKSGSCRRGVGRGRFSVQSPAVGSKCGGWNIGEAQVKALREINGFVGQSDNCVKAVRKVDQLAGVKVYHRRGWSSGD
jgi:hypothetical protein